MDRRYRRVLGAPHVRGLVLASLLGRIPIGIVAIALVLFVHHATGSYGAAGAVTASYAVSSALLSIAMARLIDRHGQTVVLLCALVVHTSGTVAMLVLGLSGARGWVLAVAAVAIGAIPPISACLRPLWPSLLRDDDEMLTTAYAFDAILMESAFVIGPLLTGVLVALFSPQVPLFAGLAMVVSGTLWFASSSASRGWRGDPRRSSHLAGALLSPGLRTLLIGALGMGICFGTLEVSLAAYGNDQGISGLAGILVALQATGSVIAGFWYGANAERLGSVDHALIVLLGAMPATTILLVVAPALWAVIPLAVISGCVVAPLTATQNLLAGELAPRGAVTEAFTWVTTAVVVGIAVGNAAAGVVVDATSWRIAVLGAVVIVALAAAATLARRSTLVAAGARAGA